ncbi:hypothetical protein BKP35_11405 [Anaerobacillus arseniciselenatis]|uniref:PucR C-terminal helix-turn-helix domain-containing protein n=1 Tax=Anaerobacillus arseniciselenatis TaxID=85682 RepID=A0A1S2LHP0_9BACI|nr:helix-turn-helix domain-containing protein [Anaerobacillus arseniciselenatis]OIJ11896.1 hypothetical protein BKP35_11405 [Anaerobacillus arseniciselenatis]
MEQLRKLLNHALLKTDDQHKKNVLKYETVNGETIFLNRDHLTRDQINLLNVFLTPIVETARNESDAQKFWKALVNGDKSLINHAPITAPFYQFVHFSINSDIQNNEEFEEAVENFFTTEITVVWNTKRSGFIVLYITEDDIENDNEAMVEAIMSDFFVKMTIFQGNKFSNLEEVISLYPWEENTLTLARNFSPNNSVIKKEKLIPYILANEVSDLTKKMLTETISSLREDKELLKTIKVFLECNLNTTLAAKELFMHRNSLQYRIEKFIERSGIDIKQFQQAAALHILIALEETMENN